MPSTRSLRMPVPTSATCSPPEAGTRSGRTRLMSGPSSLMLEEMNSPGLEKMTVVPASEAVDVSSRVTRTSATPLRTTPRPRTVRPGSGPTMVTVAPSAAGWFGKRHSGGLGVRGDRVHPGQVEGLRNSGPHRQRGVAEGVEVPDLLKRIQVPIVERLVVDLGVTRPGGGDDRGHLRAGDVERVAEAEYGCRDVWLEGTDRPRPGWPHSATGGRLRWPTLGRARRRTGCERSARGRGADRPGIRSVKHLFGDAGRIGIELSGVTAEAPEHGIGMLIRQLG